MQSPSSYRRKKHVAILGGGFCGVASALELLKQGASVDLLDGNGVGSGASGVALGLLHPFVGARCRLNWQGEQGMMATLNLLSQAAAKLQDKELYRRVSLLRIATDEQQFKIWQGSAALYSSLKIYQENGLDGITVSDCYLIDCKRYLNGLFALCSDYGHFSFIRRNIQDLSELQSYDAILVAAGAATPALVPNLKTATNAIKGQILQLHTDGEEISLPTPCGIKAFLLPSNRQGKWYLGATYERTFASSEPDLKTAKRLLLDPMVESLPCLASARVVDCKSGIRLSAQSHQPFVEQVGLKTIAAAGLGSKGLLYHGLVAQRACSALLSIV